MASRAIFVDTVIFVISDVFLATMAYSEFFDFGANFDQDILESYDFRKCRFDIWILCVFRVFIMVLLCFFGNCFGRICARSLIWSSTIFCIFCSIGKFSFLSEMPRRNLFWYIFLLSWNIVGSIFMLLFSRNLLTVEQSCPQNSENCVKNPKNGAKAADPDNLENFEDEKSKTPEANFERLLKTIKCEWKWYTLGLAFAVVFAIGRVLEPYFIGLALAAVFEQQAQAKLTEYLTVMFLVLLVSTFGDVVKEYAISMANAKTELSHLKPNLYGNLLDQGMDFWDREDPGSLLSRLTLDTPLMSEALTSHVTGLLSATIAGLGTVVMMCQLSGKLFLVNLLTLPVVLAVGGVYGRFYEGLQESVQDSLSKANQLAESVIQNIRTVRSFGRGRKEAARYGERLDEVLKLKRKLSIAYVGYSWTNHICGISLLLTAIWYGGHLVLTNQMTAGGLVSFVLYQIYLADQCFNLATVIAGLLQAVGASKKVFYLTDLETSSPSTGFYAPRGKATLGRIEFKNVTFCYPTKPDVEVLKNFSLTIPAGQSIALVGLSGEGKSTLVRLLLGLYHPTEGEILLDGVPQMQYDKEWLSSKIGWSGQDVGLFSRSFEENITYALPALPSLQKVDGATRRACASEFVRATPERYHSNVGAGGVQLSGGQKQRIALARALIRKPFILVLDEATNAVEEELEEKIFSNIRSTNQTTLIIGHRNSTIRHATRVVHIRDGRVLEGE